MNRQLWPAALAIGVALVLALVAWLGLKQRESVRSQAPPPAASAPAPVRAVEPAPVASAPPTGPLHPIEAVQTSQPAPPLEAGVDAVTAALIQLLGKPAVLSMLQTDDFARRVAATVDNLAREHAPSRLWPVNPTPGRFSVAAGARGDVASDANAQRYAPYVQLALSADVDRVIALYQRLYPQLQQAYAALGFPGRHFNDRVVEVVDHLLATPEPSEPPALTLTEVRGPIAPAQPWTRYEFTDANLQARSAGQKILLRMDREQARLLKQRLAELRARLSSRPSAAR
jgi:hypothetical protein